MMKKRSTSIPKSRSFNLHYRQPQPQSQTSNSNNTSATSSSSGYNSSSSSSATQRRTMRRNHSLNSNKNNNNNNTNKKMVIQSYSELANLAAHISDDSDSDYETNNSNTNHHCSRQEASSTCDHVCDDDDDDYPSTTTTNTPSTSSYDFLSRAGLSSMLMAATTNNNLSQKKKQATTSRFKPSYLLQRRKEGLAQHTLPSYFDMTMARVAEAPSRKQSVVALLFLVAACYALMSLAGIPTNTMAAVGGWPPQSQLQSPPSSPTTIHNYYYYVNLKEPQPFRLVAKLLQAHAYVHQKQQHSTSTTTTTSFHQLGGVCGYPTYQQEAQQQAHALLEKLGLASTLLFDVCPPIEAVLHHDPHFILLDEDDLITATAGSKTNWWTPAWRRHIESQRSYYPQEALLQDGAMDHNTNNASRAQQEEGDRLWRQLMESSSSSASFTLEGQDDRRRLRGVV